MKRAIILLMLVIAHYTSTSQVSLRPIIKDSLFCWSIPQSKQIALYINNSIYCDSVTVELNKIISEQNNLSEIDNSIIAKQETIINNAYQTIDNTNKINERLQINNKVLTKDIRKQKQQKNLFGLAAIILGVLAILR